MTPFTLTSDARKASPAPPLSNSRKLAVLGQRAFTLIELLVVVLMVGILLAVALPSFLGQKDKAYDSAAKQHLRHSYNEGHALYAQNGARYPEALGQADDKDTFLGELAASEPSLVFAEHVAVNPVGGTVAALDELIAPSAYAADDDPSDPSLRIAVVRVSDQHIIYANRSRSGTIWCADVQEKGNGSDDADYRIVEAFRDGDEDDDAVDEDGNSLRDEDTCLGHDVTDDGATPTPTPTPTPTTSPVDCLNDDGDLYARCGANRAMMLMRECYAQTLDYGTCDGDAVMQLFDEGYFGVTVVSAPPNGYYIEALSATGNTYSITGSDADDGVGTCTAPSGPDPDDPGPGCANGAWLPDAYTGPMPLGPADFDADALPVLNALRSAAADCYADTGDMTWGCAVWDLRSYGFDPGDYAGMVDLWAMGPDMYQAFIVSNSGTTFTRWVLDASQPSADDMRVCDQADYGLCQPDGTFSE